MKFAIVAALFAAVAAEECDPSAIHYKIFKDPDCKHLDKEMTKEYGDVPKDHWKDYSLGCHNMKTDQEFSYTTMCDDSGIHQQLFEGHDCKKTMQYEELTKKGKLTYEWDKCEKAVGVDVWFIVHHD